MQLGRGLESLIPPESFRDESEREIQREEIVEVSIEKEEIQSIEPDIQESQPQQAENIPIPEPEMKISPKDFIFHIEVDKIYPNPHQPRRDFGEDALRELAQSIREFGILQPLVVTKVENESDRGWDVHYELVAGERRLMAAKMLGLQTVPVIIKRIGIDREKLEIAVVENIQRSDLNPIEFARAVAGLQDEFHLTQREIASRLGKSREVVANSVRLLGLPFEIQEAIAIGKINESQARLLLAIDDVGIKEKIFQDILKYNLSVREVSARIKKLETAKKEKEEGVESNGLIDPEIETIKDQLENYLGTRVDVQNKDSGGGKITITYYSSEELESLLSKLFKQIDNQSL
jgi:ParB family chromosome partitioning protein